MIRQVVTNKVRGTIELCAFDNRLRLIADRALGRPISVYRSGDTRIVVDHAAGDATGVREVFSTPMYRAPLSDFNLPHRLRVLDIGAHVGSFTLLLAALGHEFLDVTLVELNPATCARLRRNVDANIGPVGRVVNAALTGDGLPVSVALGHGDTGDSVERGSASIGPTTLRSVAGVTLDELVGDGIEPIDVCKLDVEGAEYDVFAGQHHTSLRRCRFLLVEVHDGDDPAAIVDRILNLGFEYVTRPPAPVGVHAFRNAGLAELVISTSWS